MLRNAGQSRLTAILMADAVGYSKALSGRERETLAVLVESRRLMADVVASLGGRVVGTQGDSFLSEFTSSTDAVSAALRIQEALAQRNVTSTEDTLAYRIGINLGDVYDVEGDIHGDGVNIAARLQALAEPGGILVSGAVHDLVRDRVDADFHFAGDHSLKNISGRIRAFRLIARAPRQRATARPTHDAHGYDRPSIEVQRFRVLGGGRSARKACDIVVDELTSMLSSIAGIFLIRGDLADPAEGGNGAGARPHHYRLSGSGTVDSGRFKLNVQLVEGRSGRVVWSDRSETDLDHTFKMPDTIAREVTTALQVSLTEGETARLWNSGTPDTRAWELYQRGRDKAREVTRTGHREARRHFRAALAQDPSYLAAIVSLGYSLMDDIRHGWASEPDLIWPTLNELHRRAAHLGATYPDTHGLGAYILVLQRRYDDAITMMRHAVSLSRGDSVLMAMFGTIYTYAGRHEDAMRCYEQAVRMNPYSPLWVRHNLAWGYWLTGRFDEAFNGFQEVLKRNPGFVRSLVGLICVQCQLGRIDEARTTAEEVMRLDPLFTVEDWAAKLPNADVAWVNETKGKLRKAGLK